MANLPWSTVDLLTIVSMHMTWFYNAPASRRIVNERKLDHFRTFDFVFHSLCITNRTDGKCLCFACLYCIV